MLTRNDLTRLGSVQGFNLGQAQADYTQHLFLYFLYRRTKDELIFKGGTCLQKTFGLNRFSDDLDFTMNGSADLRAVAGDISTFGYAANISKTKADEATESYILKARGPLYDGTEKSLAYVRIEISIREKAVLRPEVKTITPIYPDLPPYTIAAMRAEEILAEKVRAIATRDKARDVYDLWFMLEKGVPIDLKLVNKKLKYYDKEFDRKDFLKAIYGREKIWEKELKPLLQRVPAFKAAAAEIVKRLGRGR